MPRQKHILRKASVSVGIRHDMAIMPSSGLRRDAYMGRHHDMNGDDYRWDGLMGQACRRRQFDKANNMHCHYGSGDQMSYVKAADTRLISL